jgi:GNAT superfamily N-acetyltransferase
MATITTAAVTPERWDDLIRAFGPRGAEPGWCWCQRLMGRAPDGADPPSNRDALRREVGLATVPPGVLAYADGTPVGWSRVTPRAAVPGVRANRALRRVLVDDPGAWWVTCFAVDRRHRSMGVATALLEAAVAHAARHGGTALEGHPVDPGALASGRVGASALFTGTMRTFVACGFYEVGRTYRSRPVMRRDL